MDAILDALRVEVSDRRVHVDLSHVRFLRPVHMVAAVARAHAALHTGRAFHLSGPTAREPRFYGARMRLGDTISGLGGTHDLPTAVAERDRAESLLEISQVRTAGEVRSLARLVHGKVAPIDDELANTLYESLGEIGANVQDHAGSVGFLAAQTMPGLAELRFAVADAGVGLYATLRGRGARDDADAIRMALDGVSRYDDPDRGTGVRETARAVSSLRGRVVIASGGAEVTHSAAGRRARSSRHHFPGTLFEASIPLGEARYPVRAARSVSSNRHP